MVGTSGMERLRGSGLLLWSKSICFLCVALDLYSCSSKHSALSIVIGAGGVGRKNEAQW